MEEKKIEFTYKVLKTEELSAEDAYLRRVVLESSQNAYAPYSKYSVGAAVVFDGGGHVKGCNQENAAYPLGICAERVALNSVATIFPNITLSALGVIAVKDGDIQPSVSPCGGCRQVLLEAEQRQDGKDIRVLLFGRDETIIVPSAKNLLPLSFGKMNL